MLCMFFRACKIKYFKLKNKQTQIVYVFQNRLSNSSFLLELKKLIHLNSSFLLEFKTDS